MNKDVILNRSHQNILEKRIGLEDAGLFIDYFLRLNPELRSHLEVVLHDHWDALVKSPADFQNEGIYSNLLGEINKASLRNRWLNKPSSN